MIAVLEGPDGCGKTTLAHEFEKLGFEYRHNGPPPPGTDMFEEYSRQIASVRIGEDVVFDRLHLGEIVYGEVVRGKPGLTIHQLRLLNRLLFAKGGVIIICTAPSDEIIERWLIRKGQEYVQKTDQMKQIITAYYKLYHGELRSSYENNKDLHNVHHYRLQDWTGHAAKFAEMIVLQRSWYPNTEKNGVIGSLRNRYLFVGEQVGPKAPWSQASITNPPDLAFYNYRGSAGFLNEAIWEAGYHEEEIAFTNALDVNGHERDIHKLWHDNLGQIVIVLGEKARNVCADQGVPHLATHHPQYVKRFHANKRFEYVQQLNSFHTMKGPR